MDPGVYWTMLKKYRYEIVTGNGEEIDNFFFTKGISTKWNASSIPI